MSKDVPLWQKTISDAFPKDPQLAGLVKKYNRVIEESGRDGDDAIAALSSIGQVLLLKGAYLDALGLLNEARGYLQDRRDSLHPLMAEVLASLGDLYLAQGMHLESLPYFEKALAVREALCISENEETARLFMKTGEIFATNQDLSGAEDFFNRAYQVAVQVCPDVPSIRGDIAHNLSLVLMAKGEPDRAIPFLKEAVKFRIDEYGNMHEEAAIAYINLAKGYELDNQPLQQANSLYKAIEVKEELYGIEDPTVNILKDKYQEVLYSVTPQETDNPPVQSKEVISDIHIQPASRLSEAMIAAAIIALEENNITAAKAILKLTNAGNDVKDSVADEVYKLIAARLEL